ncbi:hypothetical protein CU100_13920 [Phyllobacterium endophyticum]|uniref:Calcium-binding protein n=2 Tax=Phyllobacterium endophyticum TaxID=1149773 RepID=A0A2P7AWS3_9HYPH|nr:hypothetical protein CU100_13920 [Phyllobacterium endophyticum]
MEGIDTITGGAGNDYIEGGAEADIILLDGGGNSDTLGYYNSSLGVKVTLNEAGGFDLLGRGAPSGGDAAGDKVLGGFENLVGSQWADTLTGNTKNNQLFGMGGNDTIRGLGGNDKLLGGDGNDILIGGAGADSATGQGGNDIYRFENIGQIHFEADTVQGFTPGDKIDLSMIDANPNEVGDQAFHFGGDKTGQVAIVTHTAIPEDDVIEIRGFGQTLFIHVFHNRGGVPLTPADLIL